MLDPKLSAPIVDASVDTSYIQTVVLTGQSNTATAGLYKDLELLTKEEINTKFGASSHLAAMLRDVQTIWENSLIKPKLWAASYQDKSDAVARILEAVVSGTSTEERELKIRLNSLNPDRIIAQEVAILAARNTKGAYCAEYSQNSVQFGMPRNAKNTFTPKLVKATTNDVIVGVTIPKSTTAAAAATLINTAINAKAEAIYGSTVDTATLTLTAKHKGSLSNFFSIEVVPGTMPSGLQISITEDTEGSDVVDVSGILSLQDENDTSLADLNFNFFVAPISYSISAVITDAKAKFDNVTNYQNKSRAYQIFRATAIDTSSSSVINSLASSQPVEVDGIVKSLSVLKLVGLKIKGVSNVAEADALEAKQFTAIKYESDTGIYYVGACSSLSSSIRFKNIEAVIAALAIRRFTVEKMIPTFFGEIAYTEEDAIDASMVNKEGIIGFFNYVGLILDGSNVSTDFGSDYAGLVVSGSEARARRDEILRASTFFDKSAKMVALNFANELLDPIRSIFIINSFR